jgi:DNA-binding beta-propeller fold protein YncE
MRNIIPTLMTLTTALFAQSDSSYRVTHTYTLGGDGSWDYVVPDPPNHRLFIARQTRVMVVDEDSGKLLGEVEGIRGAHGTAVAESTGHGFATEGNGKSVVMFDLKTFKVLGRIPAAEDADAIIYDSASNRVFTLNGDAHSSTVIDARAGTLITNIPLGGKPEYGVSAGERQGVRESYRHERGGGNRREDRRREPPLADRAVQTAGRDGDRYGAPPAV